MIAPAQRGTTTVSEKAVRRIAERAATESLPGRAVAATSVSAVVRGRRAKVALDVALPYPDPVTDTVKLVQEHVTARTGELSGLDVSRAEVSASVLKPDAPLPGAGPHEKGSTGRAARRWWSSRRLPVAFAAGAATLVCGAVTVDLVRVHLLNRTAARWRSGTVDWLSTHGAGDLPVVLGGAGIALAGLVLIVLAVTPGKRHLLSVVPPAERPAFALDRSAVAALVQEAVGDVPGIGRVKVRAGRRRVLVGARLSFGDRKAARSAVQAAAAGVVEACALRRDPRVRVRLRPDATWRQPPPPDAVAPPQDDAVTPRQDTAASAPAPTQGGT
ncbi:DUF6286 domain-containing protein [Streptomyces sp. NPDC006296]|uniref:DUF6286 domain-containing Asp23/Gls24 family envelope stress response protein n=1 Tax=Streptomyces sp. NPDC006296 TaxID=3156746 RepID=UPI0033B9BCC2